MRAFRRWATHAEREFWTWGREAHAAGEAYHNAKVGLYQKVVDPARARPGDREEVMQRMCDLAAALRSGKPEEKARMAAILVLPDLFFSEICAFFDDAYRRSFEPPREARLPDRLAAYGIRVPAGFSHGGHEIVQEASEDLPAHREEWWVVMEDAP